MRLHGTRSNTCLWWWPALQRPSSFCTNLMWKKIDDLGDDVSVRIWRLFSFWLYVLDGFAGETTDSCRNYRFIAQEFPQWTISTAFECHQLGATLFHAGICHMIFVFFSWHFRYTGFVWIWTYQWKTCTGLQSRKLAEVIFTLFHLEGRGSFAEGLP